MDFQNDRRGRARPSKEYSGRDFTRYVSLHSARKSHEVWSIRDDERQTRQTGEESCAREGTVKLRPAVSGSAGAERRTIADCREKRQDFVLTCCKEQCPAAKCVPMVHEGCRHRHSRPGSTSACSRSTPASSEKEES